MIRTLMIASIALTGATVMTNPASAQELSQEHIDWCIKTHPSYNAGTNMYNVDSSNRKKCSSPFDDSDVMAMDNSSFDANKDLDEANVGKHREWCIKHHPGYRAYDNSYAAGTSKRKQCSSPYN